MLEKSSWSVKFLNNYSSSSKEKKQPVFNDEQFHEKNNVKTAGMIRDYNL